MLFISEAKKQVLANLANFSYDPINFAYLKELNVVDLFLGKFLQRLKILQIVVDLNNLFLKGSWEDLNCLQCQLRLLSLKIRCKAVIVPLHFLVIV